MSTVECNTNHNFTHVFLCLRSQSYFLNKKNRLHARERERANGDCNQDQLKWTWNDNESAILHVYNMQGEKCKYKILTVFIPIILLGFFFFLLFHHYKMWRITSQTKTSSISQWLKNDKIHRFLVHCDLTQFRFA